MYGIYFPNPISQVVLRGDSLLYIVSSQESAIHLYHISGLPLNAYTQRYGITAPLKHSLIDTPVHITFHEEEHRMYICNYHTGVIAFDTLNLSDPLPLLSQTSTSTPYLDETALHLNPKQLSVNKISRRLAVLYENPSQVRIYQYDGTFLQNVSITVPCQQISSMGAYFYLLQDQSITKMDKNGLPIQFWGEEYDRNTSILSLQGQHLLYLLPSEDTLQCLHSDQVVRSYEKKNLDNLCDVSYDQSAQQMNPKGVHSAHHPHRGDLSTKTEEKEYIEREVCTLHLLEGWVIGYHSQTGFIHYSPKTRRLQWETISPPWPPLGGQGQADHRGRPQLAISYHPFSNFIPMTNLQVIKFLVSRKQIYQSLTQAFQNSMTYLNQNKQFKYAYHDWHHEQSVVLPAHELIMIIQEKFLLPLAQWKVDPFIQRYEQHFADSRYPYYQRKRKLYLQILQTYYEANIYEKFQNDVKNIVDYDDYLNKESPMKMVFEVTRGLFPRVPEEELRCFYNKDPAKVFRGWMIR